MLFHFSSLGSLAISALPQLKNYFRDAAILQFLFIKLVEVKVCKNHIVCCVRSLDEEFNGYKWSISPIKISCVWKGTYFMCIQSTECCLSHQRLSRFSGFYEILLVFTILQSEERDWLFHTRKNERIFFYILIPFLSLPLFVIFPETVQKEPSDSLFCWQHG